MRTTWKIIYQIFRYSMKILYFTRVVISNILLLVLLIIGIGIYFNTRNIQSTSNNNALILNLTGSVVDKPATYNKFQKISRNILNINNSDIQENSLFDVVNIIRQAKNDPNITGLILLLKNFSGSSQSSLEYIGKALSEFKQSGKVIYAISDYYNQPQYLLASYANKIYLNPQGSVDLRGISTNKLYYKSCLDNLKINTHIFRVGEYKSAVEPFTRDNMSEKVRHEENIWVNQLWNQYLKTIAINRNITVQQVFPGTDNFLKGLNSIQGDTANYALQNKWIDEVLSNFLIEDEMKRKFGINQQGTSFNSISMYDYNLITPIQHNDQIAIICIQGMIIDGINDISGSISGNTIANKIRKARFDPRVKAIVIRIDSPGGSVTASELIRLEIMATRNSGKPVIISMGNIAASGGYWIATPANFIIASNSTITGSIGVFGIINTFEKSLDAIGIHSDGIDTSPISNISITKDLSAEFKKMMQLYVDTSYQYFIKTVAKSRHHSISDIDQIAQGHIWTGYDAIKHGLIDKIGDFDDAIVKAAELSGLTEYQLNWYEEKLNWTDVILHQLHKVIYHSFLKLNTNYILFTDIIKFFDINHLNYNNSILKLIWNDPKHCYALCFECF